MSTYTSQYFQNGEQLDQALMRAINAVSHAPQTLTDAQKAQARENIDAMSVDDKNLMVITVTDDGNGSYTSDKTFSEIYEFVNNGGFAVVRYGTGLYKQLTITPSACKFTQDIMLSSSLQHVVITIPASGAITRKASTIDKLKNPNAITFTGAVEATYDGSSPVTVEIPQGGSGGAEEIYVGTEKPTDPNIKLWLNPEGDVPSVSGGMEIVATGELTEETTAISITVDTDGNPFELKEASFSIHVEPSDANSAQGQMRMRTNQNSAAYGINGSYNNILGTLEGGRDAVFRFYEGDFIAAFGVATSGITTALGYINRNFSTLTALYLQGITSGSETFGVGTKWTLRGVRV